MELMEKMREPTSFSNSIGDCPILRLGTRPRKSMLALRRPGDKVVT
jgi:hypothetical protein